MGAAAILWFLTVGLYAVWGWVFVLVVLLAIAADVVFLEFDNGKGATLVLMATVAAMYFMAPAEWQMSAVLSAWRELGLLTLAYFAAGAVWSVLKWYSYVHQLRTAYDKYIKSGGQRKDAAEYVYSYHDRKKSIPPDPSEHASTLVMWMGHWPFSLLWTIINDPVRRILNGMANQLRGVYRAIANQAFAGIEPK